MVNSEPIGGGADCGRDGGIIKGDMGEVAADPACDPGFIRGMEAGIDRALWGSAGGFGRGNRKPKLFDDLVRSMD